jgi:hypothetical protein
MYVPYIPYGECNRKVVRRGKGRIDNKRGRTGRKEKKEQAKEGRK